MDNNIFFKEIITDEDSDNSEQARVFYRDMFPKLKITKDKQYVDDNTDGVYRGETIISFNTIAGRIIHLSKFDQNENMPQGSDFRLAAISDPQNDVPEELVKKIGEFHAIYHSLANFMPIPRTPAELGKKANEFNSIKGNYQRYGDFPDKFWADLKATYFEKSSHSLDDLIEHPLVKEYLENFSSWEDFVHVNYLEDFFADQDSNKFLQIAPKNMNTATYEDIEKTVDTAISIIKNRAKRLEAAN